VAHDDHEPEEQANNRRQQWARPGCCRAVLRRRCWSPCEIGARTQLQDLFTDATSHAGYDSPMRNTATPNAESA
jgi:hypothetical protein